MVPTDAPAAAFEVLNKLLKTGSKGSAFDDDYYVALSDSPTTTNDKNLLTQRNYLIGFYAATTAVLGLVIVKLYMDKVNLTKMLNNDKMKLLNPH